MGDALAVASVFLRDVRRSFSFRLFIAALFAAAVLLPRAAAPADLLGRLQILATYGLGAPAVLIAVATLVWSTGSLSREIDRRTAQWIATKPISIVSFLGGKVAGAAILAAILIAAVAAAFLVQVWIASSATASAEDRERARERFFSPRAGCFHDPPALDAGAFAAAVRAELEEEGGGVEPGAAGPRARRREVEARIRRRMQTIRIAPGAAADLVFRELDRAGAEARASGERFQIRVRLGVSPPTSASVAKVRWTCGGEVVREGEMPLYAFHDFEFSLPAAAPENPVTVRLHNLEDDPGAPTLIVAPGSVEILEPRGSFAATFAHAVILLILQTVFLAVLGVAASALFSLPTATLVVFFVYGSGLISGLLKELLDDSLRASGSSLVRSQLAILRGFLELLPDFSRENAVARLADGRTIGARAFFASAGWLVGVRSLPLFLVALVAWRRRELGGAPP